jgi:hypothetical protein
VIAGVLIIDMTAASIRQCFIDFHNNELARGTILIQRTIVPYWKEALVVTPSPKKWMEMTTESSMMNLSLTRGSHQAQGL